MGLDKNFTDILVEFKPLFNFLKGAQDKALLTFGPTLCTFDPNFLYYRLSKF